MDRIYKIHFFLKRFSPKCSATKGTEKMSQHFSKHESKTGEQQTRSNMRERNAGASVTAEAGGSKSPTCTWLRSGICRIDTAGTAVLLERHSQVLGELTECDHHVVAIMEVAKAISIRIRRGRNGRLRGL